MREDLQSNQFFRFDNTSIKSRNRMDEPVDSDKDDHLIGSRRGQRNRISTAHFDPTPRTVASYKDCIDEVEPTKNKNKKRTIVHVDSDHDDSEVEESMSVDSDLFPESDEESSSLNKKPPAVVTPPRGATNASTGGWRTSTTTSSNTSGTSNPQTDGGWSGRNWSVGSTANGWGPSSDENGRGGWSTSTGGWRTAVAQAGGESNKVRSITLTTVISSTSHIILQIYHPFFLGALS